MEQMESRILNLCWEFSHEVLFADPRDDSHPILIMNLPLKFVDTLESRLRDTGFYCTSFKPHGLQSVIVRFKKSSFTVDS